MRVFKGREEHLKHLTDDFIQFIEDDVFIPQMLQHSKSSVFVPERMSEVLSDLYELEFRQFESYVTKELVSTKKEVDKLRIQLDNERIDAKSKHNVKDLEISMITQDIEDLKKRKAISDDTYKKGLVESRDEIRKLDESLVAARRTFAKITNNIQRIELQVQSGRNYINELRKVQQLEIQKAKRTLLDEIYRTFKNKRSPKSESSVSSQIEAVQKENKEMQLAMMLIANKFNPDYKTIPDPRKMVLKAINSVHEESSASFASELSLTDSDTLISMKTLRKSLMDLVTNHG